MPGLSATVLGSFEMRCGPSCTPRYDPTPWPVPWSKSRPRLHSGARARVSSAEPVVPAGKRIRASARWPFSTSVKRSAISGVGVPIASVRVTSVVPSRYCAPESTNSSEPDSRRLASRLVGL